MVHLDWIVLSTMVFSLLKATLAALGEKALHAKGSMKRADIIWFIMVEKMSVVSDPMLQKDCRSCLVLITGPREPKADAILALAFQEETTRTCRTPLKTIN